MLTLLSFIVALGVLIAIHEYGHYRVAVACGVKVLRFSFGFGPVVASWRPRRQHPGQNTEFVLSAIPLGGYVRMLDEREAPVPVDQQAFAFNRQTLGRRAAIVAAGPLANLLLAVALFAVVNWWGVPEPVPVLSTPAPQSLAARAGLQAGDRVVAVAVAETESQAESDWTPTRSLNDVRWQLVQAGLNGHDVMVRIQRGRQPTDAMAESAAAPEREVLLPLSTLHLAQDSASTQMLQRIGLASPWMPPVLGDLQRDGAASQAGLLKGDRVLRVDGVAIADAAQLRQIVRDAARAGNATSTQNWVVEREGRSVSLIVKPTSVSEGEGAQRQTVGRIGAVIGGKPTMVNARYGLWQGTTKALDQTWSLSRLTLNMIGKMLIGQASFKHLSGPVTIAEQAGQSAQVGALAFLSFLALLSVSLGVLNLLPLPVLDGGHLMYYLWEAVTQRPVPDEWQNRLQRVGMMLMLALMSVAIFNDLSRHLN